jgi:hypothetical protein
MTAQYHHELDALAAKERLKLLRNWCLGIGVVAFLIAITASGPTNIYNPKVWDSAYYAWAALGALSQFSIALFGVGTLFVVIGVILAVLATKR